MAVTVYDQAHLQLEDWLGRSYNNPLGEAPFPLLRRLIGATARPLVLDAGCGRGATSRWWAVHAGATVDAFDPSPTMLTAARHLVTQHVLEDQVRLRHADIRTFSTGLRYDVVVAHDVLCYSEDLRADLRRLLGHVRVGGVASLTSYHSEAATDEIQAVVESWGIQRPPSFAEALTYVNLPGVEVLLFIDTTRQYEVHWSMIRETLAARLAEAYHLVGLEETDAFVGRIDAIRAAVRSGHFGHWWSVLERTS